MTRDEQELMTSFLKLVMNYLQHNPLRDDAIVDYQDYATLKRKFDASIGKVGVAEEELLSSVQSYIDYCVRTNHPQFLGTLRAGYSIPSLIGEILSNITNTTMATYGASPVATLIENTLIEKMMDMVGFHGGDGIFLTGGTQGNLVAVLSARNTIDPDIKTLGLRKEQDLVLFISDQAHYSFVIAANVLGIGVENVVRVKSDDLGRMDVEALETAIGTAIAEDKVPLFIGATAGTTALGSFDPIEKIAHVASKYKLWLHIDAAFGGSVLLSSRYRSLLTGSELADSFSWDAHKMMGVPLPCSMILMRKSGILYDVCTTCDVTEDSSYVFHDMKRESLDLGVKSLQCTRKVDALKLWMAWKYYGDEGYERRINRVVEIAKYAEKRIGESHLLELIFPRQFVNLCFRYKSNKEGIVDQINMLLQRRLIQRGKSYINFTQVKGVKVLMFNVVNPEVTGEDIDYLLDCVMEVGRELEEDM